MSVAFQSVLPRWFLAAVVSEPLRAESGIFEDEGAAVAEREFLGLPGGALAERIGLRLGRGSRLVEPIQVRFVIGDPFFDRLPGWFDRPMVSTSKGGWEMERE